MDLLIKPFINLLGVTFMILAIAFLSKFKGELLSVSMWLLIGVVALIIAILLINVLKRIWIRTYFKFFYKF